jgi:two-component sensor histidine kinase
VGRPILALSLSRSTATEFAVRTVPRPRLLWRATAATEWQGVDVEDLVRAQASHFADLVGSRIGVGGPKLCFNAAAAQAIGLKLHELATNSGKYGALSGDAGRIDVGWRA